LLERWGPFPRYGGLVHSSLCKNIKYAKWGKRDLDGLGEAREVRRMIRKHWANNFKSIEMRIPIKSHGKKSGWREDIGETDRWGAPKKIQEGRKHEGGRKKKCRKNRNKSAKQGQLYCSKQGRKGW